MVTDDPRPPPYANADGHFMAVALQLAGQGQAGCHPNPAVGCVVVRAGEIVGQGWHAKAGGPHAEIVALTDAGAAARGAWLYVTLEPCCHHGRTGPCTEAIIAAGIRRVVIAVEDPNPVVNHNGIRVLREAGIEVVSGPGKESAARLNRGFFKRVQEGLPWVTLKVAVSLDGKTALANGESQWITSLAARRDGHHLRALAGAVLTGIGTVLRDDPALTARHVETTRQPARVIIDSGLRTPAAARVVQPPESVIIFCATDKTEAAATQYGDNVDIVACPDAGQVDLAAALRVLGQREINSVLVEAGAQLGGNLMRAALVDELIVYMAPDLLGSDGQPMLQLPGVASLHQRIRLEYEDCVQLGPDLKLTLRPVAA